MPTLSVIIPVYNEEKTIQQIIEKVDTVAVDKEIIVIDDGSTDATPQKLREIRKDNLKIIYHTSNRGKGAAVLTGLAYVTGDYAIIQDADLEYDPQDYSRLLSEMRRLNLDVVLGARFTAGYHGTLIPRMGNRFLTALVNILYGVKLNDCFTCYKLFRKDVLLSLNLTAKSFDIEIEMVAKVIKRKMKLLEVPVSYVPRSYGEGKKIRWKDGIFATLSIMKYRFTKG